MKYGSRRVRNIAGQRNGRLTAIESVGRNKEGRAMWRCLCDCGGEKIVQSNNLTRSGGTKSCGCLRREAQQARLKRDGAWNEGKSYCIGNGERCYRTRAAWAKAVVRHYGNKCSCCGWDKGRCDAHHRVKKSNGGLHTLSNGTVLCPNCHRLAHEGGLR